MQWLMSFFQQVSGLGGTRHTVLNPVIEPLDEAQVLVTAYLIIFNRKSMAVMGTSVIKDRLRLTDHGWQYTHREIISDQYTPENPM